MVVWTHVQRMHVLLKVDGYARQKDMKSYNDGICFISIYSNIRVRVITIRTLNVP